MKIVSRIAECADGKARNVLLSKRHRVILHRCTGGDGAIQIAEFYRTNPGAAAATGGEMPYHFVINRAGDVEQCLKMTDYGPHARAWSVSGFGVALVGDFRHERPNVSQWQSLGSLCVALCKLWGEPAIFGHTELADASTDPNKQCPGRNIDIELLRRYVAQRMAVDAKHDLVEAGAVF